MPTLEERLEALRSRLAPYEVSRDEREAAIEEGEVGTYPGDETVLPRFESAGKKEFQQLRTERQALTDQVKQARESEQALHPYPKLERTFDRLTGTVPSFLSPSVPTPDEVGPPTTRLVTPPKASPPASSSVGITPETAVRASSRFQVEEGEIIDTQTRQILSPDQFNRLSTAQDKAEIERQLRATGLLAEPPEPDTVIKVPEVVVRGERPKLGLTFTDRAGRVTREQVPTPEQVVEAHTPPILLPGMQGAVEKLERAKAQAGSGWTVPNPLTRYDAYDPKPLTFGGAVEQFGHSFLQGVGLTSAAAIRSIGIAARELDAMMGTEGKALDDYATYRWGKRLASLTQELFPTRPDLQRNFLLSVVPQAMGSSIPFLLSGAAGVAAGAGASTTAAVTGAMAGATSGYERGEALQATDAQKRAGLLWGALLGTTEALPIADLFRRLNTATGGGLKAALQVGTIEAIEEAVQEGVQQLGENTIAKYLYGKVDQSLVEGVGSGMGAGGIVGMLTGFLAAGGVRRMPKERPAVVTSDSPFPSEPPPRPLTPESVIPRTIQEARRFSGAIPGELELAKRPPFLIKPRSAAPDLAPGLVPTTPEPAPAVSSEGGRPIAEDMTPVPSVQSDLAPSPETARAPALPPAPALPETAPVPQDLVPAMTPVMPAEAVTPEAMELSDRTDRDAERLVSNMYSFIFDDDTITRAIRKNDPESWKALKAIDAVVRKELKAGKSSEEAYRTAAQHLTPDDQATLQDLITRSIRAADEATYITDARAFGLTPEQAAQSLQDAKRLDTELTDAVRGVVDVTPKEDVLELPDVVVQAERPTKSTALPTPEEAVTPTSAQVTPDQVIQPAAPPIWELSREELDAAADTARTRQSAMLARAFGEAAPEVTRLLRVVETSTNDAKARAAEDRLAQIQAQAGLSPAEADRLLYGIGEAPFTQAEDYRELSDAIGQLDDRSPQQLGHSLRRALTDIGDAVDPATMDRRQLRAFVQLREGFRLARERGWDTHAVSAAAIDAAARRFADPDDAAFMLNRFLKGPASQTPRVPTPDTVTTSTLPQSVPVPGQMERGTGIDQAAHDAATSPTNDRPEPSQAMKEAGNYKLGHLTIAGLDISIENPEGSTRSGVGKDGRRWENTLRHHYGYIRGVPKGKDGDHIDVFVNPGTPEEYTGPVFVVDQVDPDTGRFDEVKVMVGFGSHAEAQQAYRDNYAPGWNGLGNLTETSLPAFKQWLQSGHTTKAFSSAPSRRWQAARTETNRRETPDEAVAPMAQTVRPKTRAPGTPGLPVPSDVIGSTVAPRAPTPEAVVSARPAERALSRQVQRLERQVAKLQQAQQAGANARSVKPPRRRVSVAKMRELAEATGPKVLGDVDTFLTDPATRQHFQDVLGVQVNVDPAMKETGKLVAYGPTAERMVIKLHPLADDEVLFHELAHAQRVLKKRSMTGEGREIAERSAEKAGKFFAGRKTPQYSRAEFDSPIITIRDPYLRKVIRAAPVIADTPLRLLDTSEEFPADLMRTIAERPAVKRLGPAVNQAFLELRRAMPTDFHEVHLLGISPDSSYKGVYLPDVRLRADGPVRNLIILNPFKILRDARTDLSVHGLGRDAETHVVAEDLTDTLLHELVHREVFHDPADPQDTQFQTTLQRYRDMIESTRARVTQRFLDVLQEDVNGQPIIDHLGADLVRLRAFYHDAENPAYRPSQYGPQRADQSSRDSSRSDEGTGGRVRSERPVREMRAGPSSEGIHQSDTGLQRSRSDPEDGSPADKRRVTSATVLADLFRQDSEDAAKKVRPRRPRIPVSPLPGGSPTGLAEIILNLEHGVGRKLTVGKTGRGFAGVYKPGSTATLIRYSGDLDTTAHELAHALDDKYGLVKAYKGLQSSPFDAELEPFAQHGSVTTSGPRSTPTYARAEGVAEWIRAWVVNPDAAEAAAPNFAAHVTQQLPADVQKALQQFSKQVRQWAGNTAHAKIMANVQWETPESGLLHWLTGGRTAKGPGFQLTVGDQMATVLTDRLAPFMKALQYVRDQRGLTGEPVLPGHDPALLARLYMGVNAKLDDIFAHGMIDSQLERATPGGLAWLLEPLDRTSKDTLGRDMQEVASLMIAQRTIEKARQLGKAKVSGIGAGIESDVEVAETRLAELQANPARFAQLQEAATRYRQWADANLRYLVDKGRLSEEQYEAIKANNEQYVAMQRIIEVSPGEEIIAHIPRGTAGRKLGTVGQPVKTFEGSTRTIKNPYLSLMDATHQAVREADRNEILKLFRDLLTLDRGMYQGEPVDLASVGRAGKTGEKHTIPIYVNGQKELWQFHPDVYKALKGIEEGMYKLPPVLTALPRILRATIVNAPPFALRNVIRDAWHRSIVSLVGSKPWDTLKPYSKEEIAQLKQSGGDQAGHYYSDAKSYARALTYAMQEAVNDGTSIVVNPAKLAQWARKGGQGYLDLMQQSERQGRLSEYRRALTHAKETLGYDDYHAMLYAAGQARGLLDYAVAGNWMMLVNQMIPFSNAAVQGVRVNALRAKADPRGYALRFGLFALIPTVMTYAWNYLYDDDLEEYRQLPAYQRDLFWNFKLGPDLWLKIPKPFEIGVLATTFERGMDYSLGNEKAFEGHVGAFARTLLPVDESSFAGPYQALFQATANYDFFRDRPIVPRWEENLALELRTYNRASRLGQAIQRAIGVDARKIDFVIEQQFGYLGRYAVDASDVGRKDKHGLTLSASGVLGGSPASVSLDARWVTDLAEERGLVPSKSKAVQRIKRVPDVRGTMSGVKNLDAVRYGVFRKHLNEYYAAETPADRDRLAAVIRSEATYLRKLWTEHPPRPEADEKAQEKRMAESEPDPLLEALGLPQTKPKSKHPVATLPHLIP